MNDKDARKAALVEAKKKLAERRKERENLKTLREQRKAQGGGGPVQKDYGKKAVEDTQELIKKWKETPAKPDINASSANIPGRRIELIMDAPINTINVWTKPRERYDKGVETSGLEIAQDADLVGDETTDELIEKILSTFISNESKPWPPKSKLVGQSDNTGIQTGQSGVQTQSSTNAEKKAAGEDLLKEYESEPDESTQKEPEITIMPPEEALKLISTHDFVDSFRLKTLWMERALALNEEHHLFWEADAADVDNDEVVQMEKVVFKKKFSDPSTITDKRPVTSIDFSKLNSDWFLASFSEPLQDTFSDIPDGTVCIWSTLVPSHPEYTLECQSMVTTAQFHPTNPKLVLGATVSGQIIAWDIRAKRTPISHTHFSSGHSAPVFAMKFLPNLQSKVQHIYTVSNDAKLCTWRDDVLVQPNHEIMLKLKNDNAAATTELATTCFSFPPRDINQVVLGSDEGCLYIAEIHGQHEKDAPVIQQKIEAHFGPISQVDFHPAPTGRKVGQYVPNLFLTSSYDWTVKLWDHKTHRTIQSFEQMQDYVYDVQWSSGKPSVFVCGDGSGKLTVFDLMKDFDAAVAEVKVSDAAISKLAWGRDGKYLMVGDSIGQLLLYETHSSLCEQTDDDFAKFDDIVKKRIARLA